MSDTTLKQKEKIMENLAHDLKSPIFSQISALNILLKDKSFHFNDIQRELLTNVLTSNIYMREMILNMLSNFRMKNPQKTLKISENKVEETIAFCIKSIEHTIFENNQNLIIKNKIKNPYAQYDEIEIKRVIVNLLSNASKYGKKGTKICLTLENLNENLKISITNTGKIDFANIQDAFKLYKTNSKQNSMCGSGLGLYISKQIIEAHNGYIEAKNLKNNTVKITFEIPIVNKVR